MRAGPRFCIRLLALGLVGWSWLSTGVAAGHSYDQAPASLASHLAEVAAVHQLNLIYPDAAAGTAPVPGLSGEFGLNAALDTLLHPRSLSWRRLADGSVRIEPMAVPLRLQIGTVDVRASAEHALERAGLAPALAQSTGEPSPLLAQRTAAGWSFAAPALRVLPSADLGRWLARSPNAYGQGSRLSLRGIERDSFAAQTSSVRLNGLPLSARGLDADLPLPPALAQIDFALGPQPDRLSTPGFSGALDLNSPLPEPLTAGLLRVGGGQARERRVDLQQALDLRRAGSVQLLMVDRRHSGGVQHLDGESVARERLALLRWLLEPEIVPALTLGADLLWIAAQPADLRIGVPLGSAASNFDPDLRRDEEPARRFRLDERGGRFAASWAGEAWTIDSSHLLLDSLEGVRGRNLLERSELRESGERVHTHQLAASRGWSGSPWRMRMALDQAGRQAEFFTSDQLPLSELFPATGLLAASAGSFRTLRTGVRQKIRSRGGQLWLGAEWTQLALEAGTGWSEERRTELSSLQRQVSAGCTLTERSGRMRDCSSELPALFRQSAVHSQDQRLTPAATVLYRPAELGQIGLQWRRGARSGGARPFAGQTVPFQPERSDTFELSWRSPERWPLQARLAVFRNFWRDRQVQLLDPGQSGFAIVNAGRASARGGELTLSHDWNADWTLALGLGLLRTRFERFQLAGPGAPVDLAGNAFPGAPRQTAVLSLTRAPPLGFEFGALLHAASRAEGDAFNRPNAQLPGRAELDLRIGWRARHYSLGLELQNAGDRNSLEQVELSVVGDQPRSYQLGAPRQLRATLEWRW